MKARILSLLPEFICSILALFPGLLLAFKERDKKNSLPEVASHQFFAPVSALSSNDGQQVNEMVCSSNIVRFIIDFLMRTKRRNNE